MSKRIKTSPLARISTYFAALLLLAFAAYPIYIHHKVASHRHNVEIALGRLAARMNEYYSLQGNYKEATPKMLMLSEINKNSGYELHIVRHENEHFTITATPIGKQKIRDTECGTLSLTDSGKKYITGAGNVKNCWSL